MTPAKFALGSLRNARHAWAIAAGGEKKELAWLTFLLCVDAFNIVADIQMERRLPLFRLGKR